MEALEVLRGLGGAVVLFAPGVALVWSFFPTVDWAKQVVLAVVLALSVAPALVFVANLLFGTPVAVRSALLASVAVVAFAVLCRLVASLPPRNV